MSGPTLKLPRGADELLLDFRDRARLRRDELGH